MQALRCRTFFELLFILLIGVCTSVVLIKTLSMDAKWMKVIILGLTGLTALLIIPHREKVLLCLFTFLLPLQMDINFLRESVHFRRPIQGFVISGFDVFFFALMLLWIYRLSINHTLRINFFPHVTIPFFLMFVLSLAGLSPAAVSFHVKVSVLWLMFKSWLVIIYLANNIDDQKLLYLVVGILLLTGLFQSMVGIGQYAKGGPLGLGFLGELSSLKSGQAGISRIGGTIGHANKMALFLGTLLQLNMACLFPLFPKSYKKLQWMYTVPFVPMLLTLLMTYSRGGWFSFLTGGVINCYWCAVRRTGKKVVSAIVVFGSFILFAAMAFLLLESVRNRLLMDDNGASEIRKPTAQIAKNIIYHNPWLGVGLNNYTSVIHKYDNTNIGASYHFPAAVHNVFLLIAAESGIPVLILFLYTLGYLFYTLWQMSRTRTDTLIPYLSIGFFCGLISWIMHNQKEYEYIFFQTRFWFNIGIILAMKSLTEKQEKEVLQIGTNL